MPKIIKIEVASEEWELVKAVIKKQQNDKGLVNWSNEGPYIITADELYEAMTAVVVNQDVKIPHYPFEALHNFCVIPDKNAKNPSSYLVGAIGFGDTYLSVNKLARMDSKLLGGADMFNADIGRLKEKEKGARKDFREIVKSRNEGPLGQGTYGVVRVVLWEDGSLSAIKVIKKGDFKEEELSVLDKMAYLKANFDCAYDDPSLGEGDKVIILQQLFQGEALSDFFYNAFTSSKVRHSQIIKTCWLAASSIKQLHDKHIVHRDIKESNFIINYSGTLVGTVTAIDFGLSEAYEDDILQDTNKVERVSPENNELFSQEEIYEEEIYEEEKTEVEKEVSDEEQGRSHDAILLSDMLVAVYFNAAISHPELNADEQKFADKLVGSGKMTVDEMVYELGELYKKALTQEKANLSLPQVKKLEEEERQKVHLDEINKNPPFVKKVPLEKTGFKVQDSNFNKFSDRHYYDDSKVTSSKKELKTQDSSFNQYSDKKTHECESLPRKKM